MEPNEKVEQRQVVVDRPGERREIVTETTERGPRESRISAGTVAIIAVLAITAIAAILYIVSNRNANDAANRNANLDVAGQTAPTTIVQQPAQQPPVIIQQQPSQQQAPVIIQQPAQQTDRANTSANDDANMQDIATRRLTEEPGLAGVVMTVTDARAVLTGTVSTAAGKAKAEQLVKAVRGMKSVDNRIVVMG
jgi:hypothetical protein